MINSFDEVEETLNSIIEFIYHQDNEDLLPPKGSKELALIQDLHDDVLTALNHWTDDVIEIVIADDDTNEADARMTVPEILEAMKESVDKFTENRIGE